MFIFFSKSKIHLCWTSSKLFPSPWSVRYWTWLYLEVMCLQGHHSAQGLGRPQGPDVTGRNESEQLWTQILCPEPSLEHIWNRLPFRSISAWFWPPVAPCMGPNITRLWQQPNSPWVKSSGLLFILDSDKVSLTWIPLPPKLVSGWPQGFGQTDYRCCHCPFPFFMSLAKPSSP